MVKKGDISFLSKYNLPQSQVPDSISPHSFSHQDMEIVGKEVLPASDNNQFK